MGNKDRAVKGLTGGIEFLFKKNKVDYIKGFGKITGPNTVQVKLNEGGESTVQAKNILIATGKKHLCMTLAALLISSLTSLPFAAQLCNHQVLR